MLVLPDHRLVGDAIGAAVDRDRVARAHYLAVRRLDGNAGCGGRDSYIRALCEALGVPPAHFEHAVEVLSETADRDRSGEILWSEPGLHVRETIDALRRAGTAVVVVSNSDGHAAENLRDAGICQVGPGEGATVAGVIDSRRLGAEKPDPAIFRAALAAVQVRPEDVVHVGDMVSTDVRGAQAAGIFPLHLDPFRRCRAADHRHVRGLRGIWRHIVPLGPA